MKPSPHYGTWDGTRLRAASFAAEVKSWPQGTQLELTVQEQRHRKTTPQNNYLHLLYRIAARAMNEGGFGDGNAWTEQRVKAHCKAAGLYPALDMVLPGGEVQQVSMDTAELDIRETADTIERVIAYFAELGIVLPPPQKQQELQLQP